MTDFPLKVDRGFTYGEESVDKRGLEMIFRVILSNEHMRIQWDVGRLLKTYA